MDSAALHGCLCRRAGDRGLLLSQFFLCCVCLFRAKSVFLSRLNRIVQENPENPRVIDASNKRVRRQSEQVWLCTCTHRMHSGCKAGEARKSIVALPSALTGLRVMFALLLGLLTLIMGRA